MALCFVGRSAKFSGAVSSLVGCKGRVAAGRDTVLKCPDAELACPQPLINHDCGKEMFYKTIHF